VNESIDLDTNLFVPEEHRDSEGKPLELSTYMQELLLATQDQVLKLARANIAENDERNLARRSPKQLTEYPIGSWVLYSGEGSITSSRHKLDTLKAGPFQVKSHEGPNYVITDVVHHKDREVHVTKLHPFRYDPKKTDPIVVARLDARELLIQEVLEHEEIIDPANMEVSSRKRGKRGDMWFLVRWVGHPTSEDSWERFSSIRDTEALHAYLVRNRMTSYIPQKFKAPKKPRAETPRPNAPRRGRPPSGQTTTIEKRGRGRPKKSRSNRH
jgi:hypothetical protein